MERKLEIRHAVIILIEGNFLKKFNSMVAKEVVLILCFFRVQLISAGFEKLQQRPGCHSQTIFCPCTDRQGLMKWYVAVKTCNVDPNETSSVCKGEAVSTKCRTGKVVEPFEPVCDIIFFYFKSFLIQFKLKAKYLLLPGLLIVTCCI